MSTDSTMVGTRRPTISYPAPIGPASLAGAIAAGLALGITELLAGMFERIPSAVASVGSYVVDNSPNFVKDFAISVFGTADKGALAIGTAILAVLIGLVIGRASLHRPWINPASFAAFAVVGIAAAVGQVNASPLLTFFGISAAAVAGWALLRSVLAALQSVDPADHGADDPARRRLLGGMAGAGLAAVAAGGVGRQLIISRSETVRETMALPVPRTTVPPPSSAAILDVPGITPIVVPNNQFYRIDTALVVPRPNLDSWRLSVTGMVDNEVSLSINDLYDMELHERYVTIACVSNRVGGDLVGNAKWTGIRLTEVLDMAGVDPATATQLVPRSVDGWTAGFPTQLAYDGRDPLIAIGMNGEPLPPDHGFPARLIVPGLYGYVSATKWLEEIELTTWDAFDAYWVPKGWAKEGPIKTQSRIDTPRTGELVTGEFVAGGVAWSPELGIAGVEVRAEGGDWQVADVSDPLSDRSWVQWSATLDLERGDHKIQVRAIDGTGTPQTEAVAPVRPDGATGYHTINVTVG
ncbi:MAG: molybdopterin-dependent oxidoreductase [Acidimicrobiia bacterium]|nr:molybdopterin-dependent oxidoreductase [Acidimicrobiia bacterium]